MQPSDFDYSLPPSLIAQHPLPERDASRLLTLDRATRELRHLQFVDLVALLAPEDLLVFNNSKVFPARLRARRRVSLGDAEFLLLEEAGPNLWWCLARPAKRMKPGAPVEILRQDRSPSGWHAAIQQENQQGHRLVVFTHSQDPNRPLLDSLDRDGIGEVPLPPYIHRDEVDVRDRARYQTIFASETGSVAAPTAGLHFSSTLLELIKAKGIAIGFVTLHVGLGTFAPIKTVEMADHIMHEERYAMPVETAEAMAAAKRRGGRIIAVGTTSLRALESAALEGGEIPARIAGKTRLFAYPPFRFRVVDALLTNFHLPKSTLLALVSAFASPGETFGRRLVLDAYQQAIDRGYRFFSYGDAMFIH